MGLNETVRQFIHHKKLLFDQGFLDNQFTQLEELEDESNPDFVVEVVSVFFDDSERILNDLSLTLNEQNVDFKKVDANVHQLKGSSSSIGAQRVKNACINFRGFCEIQDAQSCRACLQQVKQEYFLIKENLQKLLMVRSLKITLLLPEFQKSKNMFILKPKMDWLQMGQQIVAAGGSIPSI
ncbi:hypothetical protein V2J09_005614 [Rumex salicifolius]